MKPITGRNAGRAWPSLCFILLWGAIPIFAAGQLTLAPYLDYTYSSNIFWDSSAIGDTAVSPGLGLGFSSRSFNLFLSADGRVYRSNGQLNSSMLSGGFSFYHVLSGRSSLFVSPEIGLVQFQGDLSYMNSFIPGFSLGLKHAFSDRLFGRLGLSLRHSDYLNENSFDRLRLGAFWEMSAFFRTQTTIRFTLGMNYLLFPHVATLIASTAAPGSSLESTPASIASNETHQWHGDPNPAPPAPPAPPVPPEPDPPLPPVPPDPEPEETTTWIPATVRLQIPQPYVALRIAQGIGFKTGLVAEFLYRRNLSPLQGMQAISSSEWALEQMDEDFFWEGPRLSLGIKTEAFLGLELSADVSSSWKRYQGVNALDLDGIPIQPGEFRSDTLTQFGIGARRSFGRLDVSLRGSFRKNDSNDPYFRYELVAFTCGVGYSF